MLTETACALDHILIQLLDFWFFGYGLFRFLAGHRLG